MLSTKYFQWAQLISALLQKNSKEAIRVSLDTIIELLERAITNLQLILSVSFRRKDRD